MLLLATLIAVIRHLIVPLQWQQQDRIDSSRSALWRVAPPPAVQVTDAYAFARASDVALAPVQLLTPLKFETSNLQYLQSSEQHRAMARLTDAWLPLTATELETRAAQLTPFSYANNIGLQRFQEMLSCLYFTDEFASDLLRLGFVNSDAVPISTPNDELGKP